MAFRHFVVLVVTKSVQHSRDGDKAKKRALLSEIFVGALNFIFKTFELAEFRSQFFLHDILLIIFRGLLPFACFHTINLCEGWCNTKVQT